MARPTTLRYRCVTCDNLLAAPSGWSGRSAACPRCDSTQAVPAQDDPLAARPIAGSAPTVAGPSLTELVRIAPGPAPRRSRRAWVWAILLLGIGATAFAGWHVWRTRFAPEAVARRSAISSQGRVAWPRLAKLEKNNARNPTDRRAARRLAAAYERVIEDAGPRGAKGIVGVYNNAAWLYATTPVESVRDVKRALRYAETAVQLSGGEEAVFLDTLAEALYRNGQVAEAVRVAEKAVGLRPDLDDLREHLETYKAGLPP